VRIAPLSFSVPIKKTEAAVVNVREFHIRNLDNQSITVACPKCHIIACQFVVQKGQAMTMNLGSPWIPCHGSVAVKLDGEDPWDTIMDAFGLADANLKRYNVAVHSQNGAVVGIFVAPA
jgi:hypothetical protein